MHLSLVLLAYHGAAPLPESMDTIMLVNIIAGVNRIGISGVLRLDARPVTIKDRFRD